MSNGDHLWPAEDESAPRTRAKDNNGVKHKGADCGGSGFLDSGIS
jgi:hypothetical protein